MAITLTGHSDDLIEIEGDIREEFDAADGEPRVVAFSDGTVLRIHYLDGVWRITPITALNPAEQRIFQAAENDEDDYSDMAEVDGTIRWVVIGTQCALPAKVGA